MAYSLDNTAFNELTSVRVSIFIEIIPQIMNLDSTEFKRMKIDSDFLNFASFM